MRTDPDTTPDPDPTTRWHTLIRCLCRALRADPTTALLDVLRLLHNLPHALKRWPWRAHARRTTLPARWLIDTEAEVQALLWAVLAPTYGADLVDEHYLPHAGQIRPRADLGIGSLGLIIEVKMLRTPGDFRAVEEQVAADAALYFRAPGRYTAMVVVIYDDSDRPQPERYGGLIAALTRHQRVRDVVIVQRPSMIPGRTARGEGGPPHRAAPGIRSSRRARP